MPGLCLTMPRLRRTPTPAICAGLALLLGCAAILLLTPRSGVARAASTGQLQQRISAGQNRISSLAGQVHAASGKLSALSSSIASLQSQIAGIQRDLDAKRAELIKLRAELIAARTRLAQLEGFETRAESVLSNMLVNQ